jgi:hypothetical protein
MELLKSDCLFGLAILNQYESISLVRYSFANALQLII